MDFHAKLVSRSIKRHMLVVHTPTANATLVNRAMTMKGEVNRNLGATVDTLYELGAKKNLLQYWQRVEIDQVLRRSTEVQSIDEILAGYRQLQAELPAIRVVVDLAVGINNPGAIVGTDGRVTHLVHALCNSTPTHWSASGVDDAAAVQIAFEHLPLLLHDTLMDISMLHSWPHVLEKVRSMQPGEFNQRKFEYVKSQSSDCPYATIVRGSPTYASIASISRNPTRLDRIRFDEGECETCCNHWQNFLRQFVLENDGRPISMSPSAQIRRNGKTIFGQLSLQKLAKEVQINAPGRYILVVARRRPKMNQAHSQAVATLLTGDADAVWKANRLKLFPESDYRNIAWLSSYCDMFLVVIPQ